MGLVVYYKATWAIKFKFLSVSLTQIYSIIAFLTELIPDVFSETGSKYPECIK